MKVLLCDPDLGWSEQMISGIQDYGICADAVTEPAELWCSQTEVQGIIVNLLELESLLYWGTSFVTIPEDTGGYPAVIQSLCLQGKKVILVLPKLNYEIECACLKAGAVECIYKGQPMDLIVQRVIRAFEEELKRDVLWFDGVQFDRAEGRLTSQEHSVILTRMEQKVMEVLFKHGTELTEKQDLLMLLWGEQDDIHKYRLDTLIKHIRRKLQGFPICIYTRYGKGYYLGIVNYIRE